MKFFSSILKQKKILVFVVLFFIIGGIIMPQVAHAGWVGCAAGATAIGGAGATVASFIFPVVGTTIVGGVGAVIGCVAGGLFGGDIADLTARGVLVASGNLLLIISGYFIELSSNLFIAVANADILQKSIIANPTVTHGWAIVRDFANMFIVLGFVVVGIATILRLREYEAQKTLLPLILVALLINFSLLICGIIIDATNIVMNYFTQISGPAGITDPIKESIFSPETKRILESLQGYEFASAAFGVSVSAGIAAMIFFIYAVLLLFRYVALMLLVILSPLAFVCYVFSATKPIFNKWWQQFTQWAIIGIPTAFFIYLAGHIIQAPKDNILSFWLPVAILLIEYTLIFQTSAIGSSAAIGLATGAVGYAWGATKGTGKFASKRAWDSKAGQETRRRFTMAGEKMGIIAPGTSDLTRQKQQQEHDSEKRAGTWSAEQRKDLATGRTVTKRGRNDKLEAIKQMAEKNELGKLSPVELKSAMAYANSRGVPASVLAEKDYRAAGHDQKRVDKYMSAKGISDVVARKAITSEQLSENISKMNGKQLRNISAGDIRDNYDIIKEQFTPNMAKQFKTADNLTQGQLRLHTTQLRIDARASTDKTERIRLNKLRKAILKATR